MSTTPITDSLKKVVPGEPFVWAVPADEMARLEIELAALRARVAELEWHIQEVTDTQNVTEACRADLRALLAGSERKDGAK